MTLVSARCARRARRARPPRAGRAVDRRPPPEVRTKAGPGRREVAVGDVVVLAARLGVVLNVVAVLYMASLASTGGFQPPGSGRTSRWPLGQRPPMAGVPVDGSSPSPRDRRPSRRHLGSGRCSGHSSGPCPVHTIYPIVCPILRLIGLPPLAWVLEDIFTCAQPPVLADSEQEVECWSCDARSASRPR